MTAMPRARVVAGRPDVFLMALIALLTIIGLVAVWSASFVIALVRAGDPNHYLLRQLLGAVAGGLTLLIAMRFDYRKLRVLSFPIIALSIASLVLVLVIGEEVNGAKRWIGVEPVTVQPAEFAKLALCIYLAAWMVARQKSASLHTMEGGLIPFGLIVGGIGGLVMLEPSLGTTLILVAIAVTIFWVGGASFRQMGLLIIPVIIAIALLATFKGYRMERIETWLGNNDKSAEGFQTHQALVALGNGGYGGLGLGESRGKFFYIPESHTDGVFAVLGEETGFVMSVVVLALYGALVYRGFTIARRCDDEFGALIATGITTWVAVQAVLNIGGITSVLPLTGVPLPFMSYGNSALASILVAMGVLLSISRYGVAPAPAGRHRKERSP